MHTRSVVLALAGLSVLGPVSRGEPAADAPAQPQVPLPAGVTLGHRAAAVDLSFVALPMVEIAPDEGAYLGAISRWTLERGMWPVLIDDGTDRAREDIARFVRAFRPQRVVRLKALGPVDPAEIEPRALNALRLVWGAEPGELLETRWKDVGLRPAGVVAANAVDPSWTAAIALSAARGQPIVWLLASLGSPGGQTEFAEVQEIDRQIRNSLSKTEWTYDALGDDIDAITLCMALGGRVVNAPGVKGPFALTDELGRNAAGRWAWCGWIFGSRATSAYMAMCSLFIPTDSGWMFDSYGSTMPKEFACDLVAPTFERRGFPLKLTLPANARLSTWRSLCLGGIDAGMVQVNTSGHYNWFRIVDADAWASEVPMLLRPSLVSFTHSFSAQYIDAPFSISGRWLGEGAFGYVGSVDEPSLGGFVPPSIMYARLLAGGAWGYAARTDEGDPWKIQVVGDPLRTVGPKRKMGDLPDKIVEGAVTLGVEMKDHLENRRLVQAAADLVMLGRDEDAIRLVRSVLASETSTPEERAGVARIGLRPAFRTHDVALFVELYALLPGDVAARDAERAFLWQILRDELANGQPDEKTVTQLMLNVRPQSAVDDAAALRPHVARIFGAAAVQSMYARLISEAKDANVKQNLERAAGR